MQIRIKACLLLLAVSLSAETTFHPIVLDAILHKECARVDGKYYPYFIGFNSRAHLAQAKHLFADKDSMKFSGRLMYCGNEKQCIEAAMILIGRGIKNIDLGPYQVNPKFNPWVRIEDLFSFRKARAVAWRLINRLARRHGLSWQTLGRYHSSTEHLNRDYYMGLYRYIYSRKAEFTR